ncbi:MAG: iron-containing alcohol dehydrogenase [Anaerolineae bacterium]|nr:iron-containing alcohol dehydrogenase [Anaerolineae bacterium]
MAQFWLPTVIVAGEGCFEELGQRASMLGRRALLVCGAGSLKRSGQLDRALGLLWGLGVKTTVYDAVRSEPTLDVVHEGLVQARAEHAELLVGIGGGSAMDVAKAIAGLFTHSGTVHEYFQGEKKVSGGGLPWIAVPTTAGTGAEVTSNAVLSDPQTRIKSSLRHDGWYAHTALIDPELTLSVPPSITAASGSDALTQAIEAYTSIAAMPTTDALAMRAIELIGRSLAVAYHDGRNVSARADMLYGSLLTGMAFANARLGGVHGMAHPLGERFHIPHGVVCGLLLPYVMAYNLSYAKEKYAHVARLLGVDANGMDAEQAAQAAVEVVRTLFATIGIPSKLGPFGVKVEDFSTIIEESLPSGSLKHNPRPLNAQDVEAILLAAL